jgi:hypothetical protein
LCFPRHTELYRSSQLLASQTLLLQVELKFVMVDAIEEQRKRADPELKSVDLSADDANLADVLQAIH